MSRKKPSYSQSKEAAIQKCQNSCSEKIWKIRKGVVLIFAIKKTPPHVIPGNSLEFFKTFFRTPASGETVVTVFCSTDAVARKYQNSCLWCAFFNFTNKTFYSGQFPGNFKYFRTAISRNSFGRLLLEGFFPRKQSPESVRKAALKNLRNF